MNNKENINTGLDPEKAIYKLPIDFEGLTGYWSDLDGYHIFGYKSLIMIEEKAFWSSKETGAKFNNKWLVDNSKAPAIVFFTASNRDHVKEGDTSIKLKNSVIVDYYTNSPDFEFFIKNDTTIYVKLMLQGSIITKGLEFWSDFINKKGYWENDPRG